jgi:hypothetical protein
MHTLVRFLAFATVASLCAPSLASTPDATVDRIFTENPYWNSGLEMHEVLGFLKRLQAAVDDPEAFASLVHYPPRISVNGFRPTWKAPSDFERHFKCIITPGIRQVILDQDPEDLISRNEGIGLGTGQLWFGGICPTESCEAHAILIFTIQDRETDNRSQVLGHDVGLPQGTASRDLSR